MDYRRRIHCHIQPPPVVKHRNDHYGTGVGEPLLRNPVVDEERMRLLDDIWTTITSNGNGSPYTMVPLSILCLSVPLAYCGQTVEWIKIPLGTEVGLDPDDIVLDADPAFTPMERCTAAKPLFGPCLLWPSGRPS